MWDVLLTRNRVATDVGAEMSVATSAESNLPCSVETPHKNVQSKETSWRSKTCSLRELAQEAERL